VAVDSVFGVRVLTVGVEKAGVGCLDSWIGIVMSCNQWSTSLFCHWFEEMKVVTLHVCPFNRVYFLNSHDWYQLFQCPFPTQRKLCLQTPSSVFLTYTCKIFFPAHLHSKMVLKYFFLLELVISFAAGIVQLPAYPNFWGIVHSWTNFIDLFFTCLE
jgi:hypothetical protein